MNLVILHSTEIDSENCVRLRDARARHLVNVLKVLPEQAIRIGLLNGPTGTGRVVASDGREVRLECRFTDAVRDRPRVDLLLALPRPKVLQRLWAQLAALGVGRIILTNAERVERHYFDTHILSPDVYTTLLIEGLQQARDTHLPVVTVHRQFRVLVEDELDALSPDGLRLVAHPTVSTAVRDALQAVTPGATGRVLLAIGPEGGWNAFELQLLERHRFVGVSLGERTLRSDTACIALLAVLNDAIRAEKIT